ncbi:MAG: ABC transporter ATP-binding protein [Ignavibacteriaceae bacterium]
MLKVEYLTKEFKGITAVKNLSFTVGQGMIFGLLGPNGAGKTTTIRTIINVIKPTRGKISFEDKPLTESFYNQVGYLPEERGLYKKSKVIDVILYLAEIKGMTISDAKNKALTWLRKFEIENYTNKKIEELSKGNQQKVQFISAVIHNPKLLILDEPFSGFDPINQQLIKELILSLVKSGKIIILSTHQMETAEKLCTDILLINKGEEVCGGSLAEIKKKFGSNLIKVEYSGDGTFLKFLPEVAHIDNYSNYAEIQLKDEIYPHDFLRNIVSKVDVKYFSVIEPSLNKIFIDLIEQSSK